VYAWTHWITFSPFNRNDMTDKEGEVAQPAPPYIEFDPDGNVRE